MRISTNKNNTVLDTSVTSQLKARIKNHKIKKYQNAFTARYHADKLVWHQEFNSITNARERKVGSRAKKIKLI
jgi:putative endonuclease